VLFTRAYQLFRHLKAARLETASRPRCVAWPASSCSSSTKQSMDQVETADFYELTVERHHRTATILTSNTDPS
jgi:hypothetical protein